MTCSANILPHLYLEDRPLALYQGIRQVAAECAGRPPRFPVDPLPTGETRPQVFKARFRSFIEVRDDEGAERCLRTAIDLGIPSREIADMVFAAATDRVYLDAGHVLDFCNKAFELLDHIGWEHAGQALTSLVRGIATAPPQRGAQLLEKPHRPLLHGLEGPRRPTRAVAAGSRLEGSMGRRTAPG